MNAPNCQVFFKWAGAIGCALATALAANAQTVRLHGAIGLANMVTAKKADIEAQSGAKIEVVANGSSRGIADLNGGRADIALLAGDLKLVADAVNKEKPGSIDIAGLKTVSLISSKIGFFTNPALGIKKLTDAQARDVLTGKTTNWKQVGGPDLPVKLVLPFAGDGARITGQAILLRGADFATGAIVRSSGKDVAVVVEQLAGSCCLIGVRSAPGTTMTLVELENEYASLYQLVFKAEPAGDVKKVIDAAAAAIK